MLDAVAIFVDSSTYGQFILAYIGNSGDLEH